MANGHLISGRMMGAILSGVPVCALLAWTHLSPNDLNAVNAAVLTSLTITALGATFRRVAPARTAMAATIVIAFGTSLWTVAASQTWPQTGDALWLSLMLLAVSWQRLWWAGFALLPALITRPHLAVVCLVMGLGLATRARSVRPLLAFGVPPAIAGVLLLFWNHTFFDQWNLLGAYQGHTAALTAGQLLGVPYWEGALATFFAPSLGLFVFTPVAALAVFWMWRSRQSLPSWTVMALVGGLGYEALQLKLDIFTGGGGFYGGRLVIELVVLASPAAVAGYLPWSNGHLRRRLATTVLCAASIATFAIGARLPMWLLTLPTSRTWLNYYPLRVVEFAGDHGELAAATSIAVAAAFVIARVLWIRQADPPPLVGPRESSEDSTTRAHQLS